jgi:hypothetical protein
MSMADEIVSKTKQLAFEPANISHPFETHGGGGEQTVEAAMNGSGKELQESYRSGFGQSAKYNEKVTGR